MASSLLAGSFAGRMSWATAASFRRPASAPARVSYCSHRLTDGRKEIRNDQKRGNQSLKVVVRLDEPGVANAYQAI